MRSIFNVNAQAQAAALASLDDDREIARRVKHVHEARTRIFQYLALAGHKPLPSRANFVFAEAKDGSGTDVEQRLLKLGVAVRALDGFGAPARISRHLRPRRGERLLRRRARSSGKRARPEPPSRVIVCAHGACHRTKTPSA